MKFLVNYFLLGLCAFIGACQAALLGIDYGQQYTKACILAPGIPFEIVLTADSKRKDLSGLTFKDSPGSGGLERYYGNAAANLMTRFPSESAFFFKSLLGLPLDVNSPAVKNFQNQAPGISLIPSSNNRSTISLSIFDDPYPLEEILGMNLLNIKNQAKGMLSGKGEFSKIKGVVMTVPSFFNVHQRQSLEDAIELSGFPFISLIESGSAVATNFASTRQFSETPTYFLIYDMGAGSTSSTLVSIKEEFSEIVIDVEGIAFDQELGGQFYTEIIKQKLISILLEQNPAIKKRLLLKDARALSKLWKEAERAKAILSANSEVICRIESVYEEIDFRSHLKRSDFEEALAQDTYRIKKPILDALTRDLVGKKPLPWKDLEGIIFMGGSTRVPYVQKEIQDAFPDKIMKYVNTDEAAVLGATLRGVGISKMFKSKNITVIDRAIWDYSAKFGSQSELAVPLFSRGSPLKSVTSASWTIDQGKDFEFTVSENGKDFVRYEFPQAAKVLKDLNIDKYEEGASLSVNATFELTTSRLIRLIDAWIEVRPVQQSIVSSTEDSKSIQTTSTSEQAPKQDAFVSVVRKTLSAKIKHLGSRPMGAASKEFSKSRLNELERIDNDRKLKESIRNELEATLYRIKELGNADELQEDPSLEESELLSMVNESLDWLDYEGFQATTKELKQKLAEAKKLLAEHSPRTNKSSNEQHGVVLKSFTDRIAVIKERISTHPDDDTKKIEQIIKDSADHNINPSSIKDDILEVFQTEIKEEKQLQNSLDKAIKLSLSIIESLSKDDQNVEDYLLSLEKLVQQNEQLEAQLNVKRTERIDAVRQIVLKARPSKEMEQDEL